jgi:hypothetical protein
VDPLRADAGDPDQLLGRDVDGLGLVDGTGPDRPAPLQAIVRAVDPHLDVEIDDYTDRPGWTATLIRGHDPAPELPEVAVTRFSTGSSFAFEPRRSLPITPV